MNGYERSAASSLGFLLATAPLLSFVAHPLRAQSVRDSAGVQIVQNVSPHLSVARAWRIDSKPVLRIGGNDGAPADSRYEFNLIMGVGRMSDGRWAVAVQGSHTVRFFDAAGRFAGSAGRQGQGPGEFQQILGMTTLPGDTIVVTDLGEIEYFDRTGRFLRQGASRRTMPEGGFAFPVAILPGTSFLGFRWGDFSTPSSGGNRNLPLLLVSDAGARIDTVAIVPIARPRPGGDPSSDMTFGPRATVATSGDRIWFGYPDQFEVRQYQQSGTLQRLVRRRFTPVTVGGAEREGWVEHMRWYAAHDKYHPLRPGGEVALDRALRSTPFAERFPVFGQIIADRTGNLWVQQYDWHSALLVPGPSRVETMAVPSRWDVFDPRGRWLCTVELPDRFTPLEIGADYVAGLARDEDDVEQVRVYRLLKP